MNSWALFVLGLLLGWLIEWIMDWLYWRRRVAKLAEDNTSLQSRIASIQMKKPTRRRPLKSTLLTDRDGHDNFQAIKGIGPAFSKRLRDSGIHTFERLSQLTPEEMEQTLGTLYKRFFSKENQILEHARELAELKARSK